METEPQWDAAVAGRSALSRGGGWWVCSSLSLWLTPCSQRSLSADAELRFCWSGGWDWCRFCKPGLVSPSGDTRKPGREKTGTEKGEQLPKVLSAALAPIQESLFQAWNVCYIPVIDFYFSIKDQRFFYQLVALGSPISAFVHPLDAEFSSTGATGIENNLFQEHPGEHQEFGGQLLHCTRLLSSHSLHMRVSCSFTLLKRLGRAVPRRALLALQLR